MSTYLVSATVRTHPPSRVQKGTTISPAVVVAVNFSPDNAYLKSGSISCLATLRHADGTAVVPSNSAVGYMTRDGPQMEFRFSSLQVGSEVQGEEFYFGISVHHFEESEGDQVIATDKTFRFVAY
jgi:hypothetical protein